MKRTLAIETSCDDTSLALVSYDENNHHIAVEKMLSYSQVATHNKYGGVVPEIASREHAQRALEVLNGLSGRDDWVQFFADIDFVSVTTHPWLPWSLSVGKTVGHMIEEMFALPYVAVNHVHGHVLSLFADRSLHDISLPMIVLSVSGGHNDIYLVVDHSYERWSLSDKQRHAVWPFWITKLGQTIDDAAGEAYDKVSRMLWWPYPWGKWIDDQAIEWLWLIDTLWADADQYRIEPFTRTWLKKWEYNFSFSWMKSQVHRLVERHEKLSDSQICAIAYEFQQAMTEMLAKKLVKATIEYGVETMWLVWGVSASRVLRKKITDYATEHSDKLAKRNIVRQPTFHTPAKFDYCTDNGAMIGVAGLIMYTSDHA